MGDCEGARCRGEVEWWEDNAWEVDLAKEGMFAKRWRGCHGLRGCGGACCGHGVGFCLREAGLILWRSSQTNLGFETESLRRCWSRVVEDSNREQRRLLSNRSNLSG